MNARTFFDLEDGAAASSANFHFNSYVDVLGHHAALRGERLALTELPNLKDEGRRYTYAEVDRRCRAIAAKLQALGAAGERALLVFDNDADYLLSFLACAYAGVIAVPLFAPTQRNHVARFKAVAADCGARLLLTNFSASERQGRLGMGEADFPPLLRVSVDAIDDAMAAAWQPYHPAADEVAFLQYTSGSTGMPRGVMVTHGNLMYQGRYIQNNCALRGDDRALSWLPLYHDMGLIVGGLQPLFCGYPLWLALPQSVVMHPERWLRAISQLRITHAGAPNFIYDLCCNSVQLDRLADVDLSCWAVAFNSAEPIRQSSIARFTRTFAALGLPPTSANPAYGLAEATLAVSIKPRNANPVFHCADAAQLSMGRVKAPQEGRPERQLVSCGQVALQTRVVIVDPDTHAPCLGGRIGEIWVAGPTVAKGYWGRPEQSHDTFEARTLSGEGPFLRTGDLGFLDEEGELFVTGRVKDLIIVAGKNHYPQDIEETVESASPAIRPHAVAALAVDGLAGEAVMVLAEVHRRLAADFDPLLTARAIRTRVAQHHQVPVAEVVLLERGQLPMTTSGKIQRRASRELLLAGALQVVGRYAT